MVCMGTVPYARGATDTHCAPSLTVLIYTALWFLVTILNIRKSNPLRAQWRFFCHITTLYRLQEKEYTVQMENTYTEEVYPVGRLESWHFWLIFGRYLAWILVEISTILIKVIHGFPQSFETNAENVPQIRPRPLLSTSFCIRNSLTI